MEREFVTAVDPTDPHKGNRKVFVLDVYYDFDGDMDELDRMNALAREIAGRLEAGAGCGSGVRDIEFHFDSEQERAVAKDQFRDSGFRFFCHTECLMPKGEQP